MSQKKADTYTKLSGLLSSNPLSQQVGGMHYMTVGNPIVPISLISYYFGFCIGTAVKYIVRCEHKHKLEEDLTKAVHYMALHKALVEKSIPCTQKITAREYGRIIVELQQLVLPDILGKLILQILDWSDDLDQRTETEILKKITQFIELSKQEDKK